MKKSSKKISLKRNPSNDYIDKETYWPEFEVDYNIVQEYRSEVSNIPERLRQYREEFLSGGVVHGKLKFGFLLREIIDFINNLNIKRKYKITFLKQLDGSYKIEERDKTIYNTLQAKLFIAAKKEFLDFDFLLEEIAPARLVQNDIDSGLNAVYIYSKLNKSKKWQLEIIVPNYREIRRTILERAEDITGNILVQINLIMLIRCSLIKLLMEYFRGIYVERDYNLALLYLRNNRIL